MRCSSPGPTPKRGTGFRYGCKRLEHAAALLLPLYFVTAGSRTDLGSVQTSTLGSLACVVAVAVASKLAGSYAGARLSGVPHPAAVPLAVLMNTRGLTELVIAGIGLDMHLISEGFYAMLVLMAVLTTAMTGPLLKLVGTRYPDTLPLDGAAPQPRAGPRRPPRTPWAIRRNCPSFPPCWLPPWPNASFRRSGADSVTACLEQNIWSPSSAW